MAAPSPSNEKIRPPVAAKQEEHSSSGDTSCPASDRSSGQTRFQVPPKDPFKLFTDDKLEEQDPYELFGVKVEVKHELEIVLVASVDDAPHTQSSGSAHEVPPGPRFSIPENTKRSIMKQMKQYQSKKKAATLGQ